MTAKEIQKRNKKSEQLKVLQTDDGQFFVESGEGKILYNVILGDEGNTCTCGDWAKNIKKNPNFNCKHIISVMNAIPNGEVENGKFLEKLIPRLDDRFMTNIKGKEIRRVPKPRNKRINPDVSVKAAIYALRVGRG